MSWRKSGAVGATLATGIVGGLLAEMLHVPAGALLGSSLAVAILAGWRGVGAMPVWLRDAGFTAIGVALGGGIDADLASHLPAWSMSLLALFLSLIVTLWLGAIALQRVAGFDRETAVLATAPGTMSNVIALAIEGRGDVTAIMGLQVLRVLFLVLMVPPFASLMDAGPLAAPGGLAPMATMPLLVLLVAGYLAGLIGRRFHIPAACFLFGLLISAGGHVSGVVAGGVPDWTMFAGLVVAGAAMGMRMNDLAGASWRRLAIAGAVMLAVALSVSAVFALVTALLSGLPPAQVWIALAPGGVEAMAAIGLSLGYDPAFVALHHFARILLLIVLVPIFVGRSRAADAGKARIANPVESAGEPAEREVSDNWRT